MLPKDSKNSGSLPEISGTTFTSSKGTSSASILPSIFSGRASSCFGSSAPSGFFSPSGSLSPPSPSTGFSSSAGLSPSGFCSPPSLALSLSGFSCPSFSPGFSSGISGVSGSCVSSGGVCCSPVSGGVISSPKSSLVPPPVGF